MIEAVIAARAEVAIMSAMASLAKDALALPGGMVIFTNFNSLILGEPILRRGESRASRGAIG